MIIGEQTLSNEEISRIGSGIQYPDGFDSSYQEVNISKGIERINQSINIILSTPVGRNFGNRLFGSKLHTLIFEQNDSVFASLGRLYINEALSKWEPRISVISIEIIQDPVLQDANIALFQIFYIINASNNKYNLVYPFYKDSSLVG